MNKIWRRILGIVCLVLVSVTVVIGPALADPINPPVGPPTSNSIIRVSVPLDTDVTPVPTTTTTTTTITTQP